MTDEELTEFILETKDDEHFHFSPQEYLRAIVYLDGVRRMLASEMLEAVK